MRATCRAGIHPATPENTHTRPDGSEHCRPCAAERRRESRAEGRPPLPVLPSPAWMDDALCAQSDPDAWFPEAGESAAAVRRVCAACPVRAECLDYAMSLPRVPEGIWGGLTVDQRRAERRRRRELASAA